MMTRKNTSNIVTGFVHANVEKLRDFPFNEYTFPDGFKCYSHSSPMETEFIYKEIFIDNNYLQQGVTIKNGDCVFDVGANIGLFTLYIAKRLQNMSIYAFEPIPITFTVLRANMYLHHLENVNLFNYGLGAENNKNAVFTYFLHMAGNSTLFPEQKSSLRKAIKPYLGPVKRWIAFKKKKVISQVRSLSSVIEEHRIEGIDLLKIDVEGAELEVLKGITPVHWAVIKAIAMEVHDANKEVDRIVRVLYTNAPHLTVKVGSTDMLGTATLYALKKG
jgi:FkbM family methyltransferase